MTSRHETTADDTAGTGAGETAPATVSDRRTRVRPSVAALPVVDLLTAKAVAAPAEGRSRARQLR